MDSSTSLGDSTQQDYAAMVPVIQLAEKYAPKDDWTGISCPKERRKLQNRLNQRLYRTRHDVNASKSGKKRGRHNLGNALHPHDLGVQSSSTASNDLSGADGSQTQSDYDVTSRRAGELVRTAQSATMCNLSPEEKQMLITNVNELMYTHSVAASPRLDMLLTLIHFNVFRALVKNCFSMGFDMAWLDGDTISPFYVTKQIVLSAAFPTHLRPTLLQREVDHHPWIDLFPFPAMRDNLLRADGEYDEDQLCSDLVEFCYVPQEQMGLIVWGEPGDPAGWEVSEPFLKKWGWVLKGCYELH